MGVRGWRESVGRVEGGDDDQRDIFIAFNDVAPLS